MSKNRVLAGDYLDYIVIVYNKKAYFMHGLKRIILDKSTVAKCEIVNNPMNRSALFGSTRKNAVILSIEFYSGEKSLIGISQKEYTELLCAIY